MARYWEGQRPCIMSENSYLGDEQIYGSYNLRSRTVYLSSPHELKHPKTSRSKSRRRRVPPPPTAHQREISCQEYKVRSLQMAEGALSAFNDDKNAEYELVNPSTILMRSFAARLGLISHINFEARPKNDPSAPVELFFAESKASYPSAPSRCCSLGLAGSTFDSIVGCFECWGKFTGKIHHPSDGKYICGPQSPEDNMNGFSWEKWRCLLR